jgi:hypothetical protein
VRFNTPPFQSDADPTRVSVPVGRRIERRIDGVYPRVFGAKSFADGLAVSVVERKPSAASVALNVFGAKSNADRVAASDFETKSCRDSVAATAA